MLANAIGSEMQLYTSLPPIDATTSQTMIARLDGPIDVGYYRNGGILQAVLRRIAST